MAAVVVSWVDESIYKLGDRGGWTMHLFPFGFRLSHCNNILDLNVYDQILHAEVEFKLENPGLSIKKESKRFSCLT